MKSVVFRVQNNQHFAPEEKLDDQNEIVLKKSRGKTRDYEFYDTYVSFVKAKEAIDRGVDGQHWVRSYKRTTKKGDKMYYRCPRSLYVLLDPTNDDAYIYITNNNHDHDVEAKNKRLNEDSKAKVLEMIEIGVTEPRRIIKELDKCNLPLLTKTQISNLKSRTNVKQNGNSKCTLNQWLECINKRRKLPEDIDEIFVVDYSYSFSISKPNQLKDMRCFLTTHAF